MKYKSITVALICLLAVGCSGQRIDADREIGKLRHQLFVECMELAAKLQRQGDDDVSDVVDECSNEAYYMANQIKL